MEEYMSTIQLNHGGAYLYPPVMKVTPKATQATTLDNSINLNSYKSHVTHFEAGTGSSILKKRSVWILAARNFIIIIKLA